MVVALTSFAAEITVPEGVIESNTTWTNDNVYVLDGFVAVGPGVDLTIEPGTIIKGSKANKGTLIITRGARLFAVGEECAPIVFTSDEPVGSKATGDWGGVIILGAAPINVPGGINTIEGGVPNTLTGTTSGTTFNDVNRYGGVNPADNSGILRYVRIEYCGIAFSLDNEINGLTMGGVGNATEISYVQVSYSGDDSYEWFGGTVNCDHLIAFSGLDDDWDTDLGYTGTVQYGVSLRDPNVADAAGSSNGWESDNDGSGSTNSPRTKGIFVNFTQVGPIQNAGDPISAFYRRGAQIRRSSNTSIYNSIIMGYPAAGIYIDDAITAQDYEDGNLELLGIILAGHDDDLDCDNCDQSDPVDADNSFAIDFAADGNAILPTTGLVNLADAYNFAGPDFRPNAGSLALNSTFDYDGLPFGAGVIESVEYVGAFDQTNDWTASWAEWDPQNVDYDALASIDYNPAITASAVTDATTCDNGSINITPSGGRGSYSYSWSSGDNTEDVSGLAPADYNVTVTANGCSATEAYTVAANLSAPTGVASTADASGATLTWDAVSGSVACEVQGGPLGGGVAKLRRLGVEVTSVNVPSAQLTAGTTYEWSVRCACTVSPVVATPLSATDQFTAVAPKVGEVALGTNLFPNPASTQVNLNMEAAAGMAQFSVVDIAGRTVMSFERDMFEGMNTVTFDVSELESGMYFIEAVQAEEVTTLSFQVK